MDWSNERYVRLYTRDSLTWKLWPWQSRAIFCALLRKVDRAGVLDVGDHDPALGVAAVTEIPSEVVVEFLPPLISSGAVTARDGQVALPGYLDAQEAKYSDKQRQSESRARRRAKAVTPCDDKSQPVTDGHPTCHTESQDVTPYRTVPVLTEPIPKPVSAPSAPHPQEREARPEGMGFDRVKVVWAAYLDTRANALHSLGKRRTRPGLTQAGSGRIRKLLKHVRDSGGLTPDEAVAKVVEFIKVMCDKAVTDSDPGRLATSHPLFALGWWDRWESSREGLERGKPAQPEKDVRFGHIRAEDYDTGETVHESDVGI